MGFWKKNNLIFITLGVVTYLYLVGLNTLPHSFTIFLTDNVVITSLISLLLLAVWYGMYSKEQTFYNKFTKINPIAKVLKKEGYLDTLMTTLTITQVFFTVAGIIYLFSIVMNSLPFIYMANLLVTLGNVSLILTYFRNKELKEKCTIPVKVKND